MPTERLPADLSRADRGRRNSPVTIIVWVFRHRLALGLQLDQRDAGGRIKTFFQVSRALRQHQFASRTNVGLQ